MDVITELARLFRNIFQDESIELTLQTSASDIDGWDSFAHLNIIMAVEDAFNIHISDAEAPTLKNIQDFVSLINANKLSNNAEQ